MATITSLGFDIFSHWDGAGVREARNEIERLKQDLDSLNNQTVHVRVEVANAEARARIAEVRRDMQSIGDRTARIDVDVDRGRRNVSSLRSDITDLNTSFVRLASQGMGAVMAAAVALAPALIPIGTSVLGVGAATAAMGVSAGIGFGIFGLALKGAISNTMGLSSSAGKLSADLSKHQAILSQLTPGTAAYEAELKKVHTAQDRYNHAIAEASPMQRVFLTNLQQLQAAWAKFIAQTQDGTLLVVINLIAGLRDAVGKLAPAVNALSPVFGSLTQKIQDWLRGMGFENFIALVIKTGVPALRNLISAGESMARVFGDFFRVFASQGVVVSKVLADGAAALAKWADGGGFSRFLDTVKKNAPAVSEFFKSLLAALGNVMQAMSDLGPLSLGLATAFLKLIAALPPQVIQALAIAFVAVRTALLGMAVIEVVNNGLRVCRDLAIGTRIGIVAMTIADRAYAIGAGIAAGAQWVLNAAFYGCPVVWIIAAIIAIIVVIVLIATKTTWFQTAWKYAWNAIKEAAEAVWNALKTAFHAFVNAMITAWNAVSGPLKEAWRVVWSTIKDFAHGVWVSLQQIWHVFCAVFGPIWNAVAGPLKAAWNLFWGAIKLLASGIWDAMKIAWNLFVGALKLAWDIVSVPLKVSWNLLWGGIKLLATGIWDALKLAWQLFTGAIKAIWDVVSGPLKAAWSAIWDAIKTVVMSFVNGFKIVWQAFCQDGILGVWNVVSGALKNAWNTVWNAIKEVAKAVWDSLKQAWQDFINGVKQIWDGVSAVLKAAWDAFWNTVKTVAQGIWDTLKAAWQAFISAVQGIYNAFASAVSASWNAFWNAVKAVAQAIWDVLKAAWNLLCETVKAILQAFTGNFSQSWNTFWNAVKQFAQSVWDALKSAWQAFWDAVKKIWEAISGFFKSAWQSFWDGIKKVAQTVWDALQKGWDALSNGVQKTLQTLVDKAKSIWNGIVNIFKAPVNLVIGIWDHVAGAIGLPNIDKLAEGGHVRGPGTSTSDDIPLWASDGEYVVNAKAVQHYGLDTMESINARKYADGGSVGQGSLGVKPVGSGSGNIGGQPGVDVGTVDKLKAADSSGITHTIGSFNILDPLGIGDKLKNIAAAVVYDIVKPILDKAVKMVPDPISGVHKPAGSVPHAGLKTVADGVLAKLKAAQDQAKAAASGGPSGPAPPGTVRDWIVQGLGLVGQASNQPWINGLYTIAMRESGGNPHAINLWDSNAQAGHPSKGLLQFIDSTFNAYAIPGHHDIWNPVDQVAADWGYIRATYGDITNVQQANSGAPPKGYKNGVQSAMAGWNFVGEAGVELAEFSGGEKVKSFKDIIAEIKAAASGEGGSTLHAKLAEVLAELSERTGVNISVPITANGGNASEVVSRIEAELIPKLRMMMQQHVGRRNH